MVASYLLLYKVPKTIKKKKLVLDYSFESMVSCLYCFLARVKAGLPWWKRLVEESHSPWGRQEAERGRGQEQNSLPARGPNDLNPTTGPAF